MNRRISLLSLAAFGFAGAMALPSLAFADDDCPCGERGRRGPTPERMLAHHDADGDGALDVEEIAAMMLMRAEHREARREAREDRPERGEARRERARRGDGQRDRTERGEGRRGRADGPPGMQAAQARFAEMDTNGDGRLDEEEAFAAAARFLAEHDTDGDGRLSADELPAPPQAGRGRGPRVAR